MSLQVCFQLIRFSNRISQTCARLTPLTGSVTTHKHTQPLQWCQYRQYTDDKPPAPPKRPFNSYILFVKEKWHSVQNENKGGNHTDIFKKVGDMWQTLPEDEKQKYRDSAQQDLADWKVAYQQYQNSLSLEQLEQLKGDRAVKQKKRKATKLKKKSVMLKKPKPEISSGYICYVMERMVQRGTTPAPDYISLIAKEWKRMTDEEKKPYMDKASEAKDRNEKNLKDWENQMIEQGHTDVVRRSTLPAKKKKNTIKNKESSKKVADDQSWMREE